MNDLQKEYLNQAKKVGEKIVVLAKDKKGEEIVQLIRQLDSFHDRLNDAQDIKKTIDEILKKIEPKKIVVKKSKNRKHMYFKGGTVIPASDYEVNVAKNMLKELQKELGSFREVAKAIGVCTGHSPNTSTLWRLCKGKGKEGGMHKNMFDAISITYDKHIVGKVV